MNTAGDSRCKRPHAERIVHRRRSGRLYPLRKCFPVTAVTLAIRANAKQKKAQRIGEIHRAHPTCRMGPPKGVKADMNDAGESPFNGVEGDRVGQFSAAAGRA